MEFTQEQLQRHKANTERALKWWKEKITPESVYLETWHCKSQSCFGGHLEASGLFKDQKNVYVYNNNRKSLQLFAEVTLFGYDQMFMGRFGEESSNTLSDHEVIVRRLENNLERLAKLGV